jgi:hypothetical protein
VNIERDLWLPDFEVSYREVLGEKWPFVFIQKFETNRIGERRFVGSVAFSPTEVQSRVTVLPEPVAEAAKP